MEHFAGERNHHVLFKSRKVYSTDWEKSKTMFFRITGATFEIQKTQVLKARDDMSVNLYGTPVIYWLYLNLCGRTYYPPAAFSFILFCCLFIIHILTLSVPYSLQCRMVGWQWIIGRKGLQRGGRVLVVSSIAVHTMWGYWDSTNIPARTVGSQPEIQNDHPHPLQKIPLNPKLIMDNFMLLQFETVWNMLTKCTYDLRRFSITTVLL